MLEGLLDRRARLARLMRQPSFAHYAMVRARPREISESVPHIRVGLAGLGCLMGHPSFAHHAMARARERDPRFWTHARAREGQRYPSQAHPSRTHTRMWPAHHIRATLIRVTRIRVARTGRCNF